MLPTAYPYDRERLLTNWKRFVAAGSCDDDSLDPAVIRSWQRCREAAIEPSGSMPDRSLLEAEGVEVRRNAHFDLIVIARPFMENTFQFVGERGVAVFLADRELCVLDMAGDESLLQLLATTGIEQGAILGEGRLGTNAAALALGEGIAAQVVGPEHYRAPYQTLTDTAAPIHGPHGELVGVLGTYTMESDGSPHMLGAVMAAAKAIENQMQADQSLSEAHRHLAELDVALQAVSNGILYLSVDGTVTHMNARAGEILGVSRQLAMGRQIRSMLTLPPELERAMEEPTVLNQRELVFQRHGRARSCFASMNPLHHGDELAGFVLTLELTAELRQLVHRMVGAKAHYTFDDVVGRDVEMRKLLRYARSAAQGEASVLLLGEVGTGKEVFAQAIHNASRRASGPFVTVNCAGIPREVLDIGLFGCEPPMLGVKEGQPGKIELADGGTLFLEDVDGLPLEMQAALVHIIDTKQITRLGGARNIPVDVRVIAACSNLDLANEVRRGRFRADFFYRLYVLTLTIPPLRARGNDILLLVAHLIERFGRRLGKTVTVSPQAMARLQTYHWPGNVRELENVLERAMYMVEGNELTAEHLPVELGAGSIVGSTERAVTLAEAERQAIIRAGRATQGNVTAMAKALGIGRTTLWRKMKALNLAAESFRA